MKNLMLFRYSFLDLDAPDHHFIPLTVIDTFTFTRLKCYVSKRTPNNKHCDKIWMDPLPLWPAASPPSDY